ncbi:putative dolichyl-phosphate-mannose--protein mannosyltransferase [archaeon HR01]|nr:putative dolichyl-phosphate-mannose--protein mannosyltransferase [archaeon HR01]
MDRHSLLVAGLTVFSLLVRLYKLDVPDRLIGDEVYYVPDARSILGQNDLGLPIDPRKGHPPLGKMLIALGMYVFGDNPFGWRIMSVIAGTAAIPMFYLLVRRLLLGRKEMGQASLLACYLFAFESLTFYFSRVARIDIFMMFFFIAGAYFLLDDRLSRRILSAPLFAASFLSKEAAIIMILPLIFYAGLKKPEKKKSRSWKSRYDWRPVLALSLATAASVAAIWYILEWGILVPSSPNLIERVLVMVSRLGITNPEAVGRSEIFLWFINYPVTRAVGILPGYDIEPSRVVTGPLFTAGLRYAYVIQASWTVLFFMAPSMLYMLWLSRREMPPRFTIFYWFGGLLGWIVVNTVFRGLIYLFYVLTILPPVIIAISIYLARKTQAETGTKSIKWRSVAFLYSLLHLLNFLVLFPVPLS